ncbi:E3 ubiquitin-protein ligase TRIM35-like [Alosa pseudoharengus]|uniref:E3 ubiquitin-protein ligase TRIM35-like n=1 Tax=Alosa pseudoharengus TaxID=34774 RepID=UPI003F8A81CB
MAASVLSLEEDLSCSVCCDVFLEPVLLGCGHSFCRKCLSRHWSSSPGRRCPVCRRPSPQEPVPNFSLRSTCESFLKQRREASEAQMRRRKKREEEEEERAKLCPEHGRKLAFFCEREDEPVCCQCKNSRHRGHRVLPWQRAVKRGKGRLAAHTKEMRERLDALRSGSAQGHTATAYIKAVVKKCEEQIRKDFDKVFTFLKEEQKARLEAVRDAGIRETQLASKAIEAEATLLFNQVQEAEEMAQKNYITFLQESKAIMSTHFSRQICQIRSEPARCPWAMIEVPERLGNLRFNVWKKMKEVAPCYPVILNPSTPLVGLILSDDLTSVQVEKLPKCYSFVAGSKALDEDYHVWDVCVSDCSDWIVGMSMEQHSFTTRVPLSSSPFWSLCAIQRKKDQFFTARHPATQLKLTSPLQVLRVKLSTKYRQEQPKRLREIAFSDAQKGSTIFRCVYDFDKRPRYPILCPLQQGGKLTIQPAEVMVEVKAEGFWKKYGAAILCIGIWIITLVSILLFTDTDIIKLVQEWDRKRKGHDIETKG